MNREDSRQSEPAPAMEFSQNTPALPWLLILCLGSGCAALIYEIVWFQILELVIGSSAVSLGLLLGAFMGGMCLGSIFAPRWSPRRYCPLRLWALLQVGTGLLGLGILVGLPYAARIYASHAPSGFGGIVFRGALCLVFLLPPTVLSGASLPVIARCVEATPEGPTRLGLLYASNTVGAVLGCLLAGFYLLPVHDTVVATLVAAVINGSLALAQLALYPKGSSLGAASPPAPNPTAGWRTQRWVLITIGLSGLCALAAEVVWTRLLSLILGATVYTFSIILAVYLAGLGVGSVVGAFLARRSAEPGKLLGLCQVLLAAAIAWAALVLCRSLPYWPINPSLARSVWFIFQLDLLRCLWAIFPATCLWGASFPLALAAAAAPGEDSGRLIGTVYAANTAGAIVGALACSLALIGWLGTQQTQRVLVGLSTLAGCIMFLAVGVSGRSVRLLLNAGQRANRPARLLARLGMFGLAAGLMWSIPPLPWGLVAFGRNLPVKPDLGLPLYVGEGLNASVAVSQAPTGQRLFHVSGKTEASSDPQDMRLQQMLAHLPAFAHPDPRSVLVVGCGAGVTAGSFVLHPSIERVVVCEIEPLIPARVVPFFAAENHDVLQDPRVSVVCDDARHYILRSAELFDIITSDPIHPWVKGAATLYTREYFQLCRQHLNPGGLVSQWVPLYESSPEAVKTEIATFFEVFPNGTVWSNDELSGGGYDLVLLGLVEPLAINLDELQKRWHRADHAPAAHALSTVGISSAFSLLTTYAGRASDLEPWLQGALINRDRNLRLQYLAALGINQSDPSAIYAELLRYRKFPEGIFIASSVWDRALRQNFERSKPND